MKRPAGAIALVIVLAGLGDLALRHDLPVLTGACVLVGFVVLMLLPTP